MSDDDVVDRLRIRAKEIEDGWYCDVAAQPVVIPRDAGLMREAAISIERLRNFTKGLA